MFEELQREKKLKSHQMLSETLKNLLNCVYNSPSYIAKDLMKVLQEVNGEVCAVEVDCTFLVTLLKVISNAYV